MVHYLIVGLIFVVGIIPAFYASLTTYYGSNNRVRKVGTLALCVIGCMLIAATCTGWSLVFIHDMSFGLVMAKISSLAFWVAIAIATTIQLLLGALLWHLVQRRADRYETATEE